ncbi:MAG TPA: HAD family phosphatase [Phycisphaeraceae bacterium]
MLKAIVFDFDGVLVDSEPLHYRAFLEVGRGELGLSFDYEEYLDRLVGYDDRDAFRLLLTQAGQQHGQAELEARVAQLCQQKQQAFEQQVGLGVTAISGALELVDEAAAAMPIAIASGATVRDIELVLGGLGRRDRFQVIVAADHVRRSKPDPESYALAVEQLAQRHKSLELSPADCLAIEDTAAGIASARGAGLMTLGLATTGPADRLHNAHRVIPSLQGVGLAQLREWFG